MAKLGNNPLHKHKQELTYKHFRVIIFRTNLKRIREKERKKNWSLHKICITSKLYKLVKSNHKLNPIYVLA